MSMSASALTILPMTFDELVDQSIAVVYGRVADVRGQWTSDRRAIESLVSIDAIDYFKGNLSDRVIVRMPGGRVGPMVGLVPGAPTLAEGDVVVVFLKATGPAIPIPTGLSQGVFRVSFDNAARVPMVRPPVLNDVGAGRVVRGDLSLRPLPLAEFSRRVHEAGKPR
jgi:hypothetical protein